MYLVFVSYKDVSHVHFDGAHVTGVHTGLASIEPALLLLLPLYCSRRGIVTVGKYVLKLIVPAGRNQGNTV